MKLIDREYRYVYDATIHYAHTIEPRKEAVDKACFKPHVHKDVKVRFKMSLPQWTDFKTIKTLIEEKVLKSYRGKIAIDEETNGILTDAGILKYNNIGNKDTETVLEDLSQKMYDVFPTMLWGKVQFKETNRYGMEVVIRPETRNL